MPAPIAAMLASTSDKALSWFTAGATRAAAAMGPLLPAAVAAMLYGMGAHADGIHPASVSRGEVEAKISYCQDCHGPSGQGYRGYFPIPRLAGQQVAYIENQLQAFVEHRRTNNIMFNVAHGLSPAMISALAADFRKFDPGPLGGAPPRLVPLGRKILQDGIPESNIAACAACHGPDASGHEQIPRLAGQVYSYVVNKLTNWDKERGQIPSKPDISAVMNPVAHSLNKTQIEAVAAYVSTLK